MNFRTLTWLRMDCQFAVDGLNPLLNDKQAHASFSHLTSRYFLRVESNAVIPDPYPQTIFGRCHLKVHRPTFCMFDNVGKGLLDDSVNIDGQVLPYLKSLSLDGGHQLMWRIPLESLDETDHAGDQSQFMNLTWMQTTRYIPQLLT